MKPENLLTIIDTLYTANPTITTALYVAGVLFLLCIFMLLLRPATRDADEKVSLIGHLKNFFDYYRFSEFTSVSHSELPKAPTDREKYLYVKRRNLILSIFSTISFLGIGYSTYRFLLENPILWPFFGYLVLTTIYFIISLFVNLFSRDFNLKKHTRIRDRWKEFLTARVDIFLPTAGEPLEVLQNTWDGITELEENYRGSMSIYVLDDSDRDSVRELAEDFGFNYIVRPKRGWFKKAGNLRYGYKVSNGEYIAIFDADFRPRKDFLHELLPYFYEDKTIGIVQSPQYFDVSHKQNWLQRGAGSVQELFYRVSQVSRQAHDASICVGTNAVYRREALAETGGTALIQHSEDVHTGFNIRMRGWTIQYVPIILAKGLCPNDMQAFFKQQYRWCLGSMTLLSSGKFWGIKLSPIGRLSYFSGFLYYIHTAISSLIIPIIPIIILLYFSDHVTWENYLFIIPSLVFVQLIYPMWHTVTYGIEAWSTRSIYGWSHLFAIVDAISKNAMSWQPTGAKAGGNSRYTIFRVLQIVFNLIPALIWVSLAGKHVFFEKQSIFLPLLIGGIYYYLMCAKVSFYVTPVTATTFFSSLRGKYIRGNAFIPLTLLLVCMLSLSLYEHGMMQLMNRLFEQKVTISKASEAPHSTGTLASAVLGTTNEHLVTSWVYYKKTFITPAGQSIDPDRKYKTTSEGQSYILLRSVIMNDKQMFETSWSWTKEHLQHTKSDKLFSWLWGEKTPGEEMVIENNNATDADEDIALALILAGYRWGDEAYLLEAQNILTDLWERNVVTINDRYYLLAGAQFDKPKGAVVNPSYLSPASYRVFSVIDVDHPWNELADDSYTLLKELQSSDQTSTGLPPNWILVDAKGSITSPDEYIESNTANYGYDAFRTYWRVALDAHWFDSEDAKAYLSGSEEFFREKWNEEHGFKASYNESGIATVTHESISTNTGPLSVFLVTDTSLSSEIYSELFLMKYNKKGYWGDGKNYYDQNWAWFGAALYTDNFTLPEKML